MSDIRFCSRLSVGTIKRPVRRGRAARLAGLPYTPVCKGHSLRGFALSIKLINAVVESAPVHGGEYLLLICMARYAADDGSRVFPSVSTLARDTRQEERSVHRQLRSLEGKGLLVRVGTSRHSTINYRIAIEKLSTTPDQQSSPRLSVSPATPVRRSVTPDRRSDDSLDSSLNRQNPEEQIHVKTDYGSDRLREIQALLKSKPLFKGMP